MKRNNRALVLGAVVLFGLSACGGSGAGGTDAAPTGGSGGDAGGAATADAGDQTIGVAMPTQTSERWIADGEAVQTQLEEAGCTVDLQFAGDDIPTQSQQVDQMITQGADALIIAAIDGTALSGQLQAAAEAGIPVISYDRLIRDSENVDSTSASTTTGSGRRRPRPCSPGWGCRPRRASRARRPAGTSPPSCPARTSRRPTSGSSSTWASWPGWPG